MFNGTDVFFGGGEVLELGLGDVFLSFFLVMGRW